MALNQISLYIHKGEFPYRDINFPQYDKVALKLKGKQATSEDALIPLWRQLIKLFDCKAKQSEIWNNFHFVTSWVNTGLTWTIQHVEWLVKILNDNLR